VYISLLTFGVPVESVFSPLKLEVHFFELVLDQPELDGPGLVAEEVVVVHSQLEAVVLKLKLSK